jgi:hypothetical protein
MEITLNEEQRLFVLKGDEYVSCLGFDVVFDHLRELSSRINRLKISTAGIKWAEWNASEIGTLKQYQQYQDLLRLVEGRKIGTWFSFSTPTKVRNIIEKYRKEGGRLRVFYGDTQTGLDWLDEYEVMGEVRRSMGLMQIPLLIGKGEDGSSGMLDSCIVRILDADTREELYRHKKYFLPEMEIREVGDQMTTTHSDKPPVTMKSLGYSHGVYVRQQDGTFTNNANFRSFGKAAQWVAFMSGECCEQPS